MYGAPGALNVMVPFIVLSAIMTFVWPFATSKGALIAIAVIYGCVPCTAINAVCLNPLDPTGFHLALTFPSSLCLPYRWVLSMTSVDAQGCS